MSIQEILNKLSDPDWRNLITKLEILWLISLINKRNNVIEHLIRILPSNRILKNYDPANPDAITLNDLDFYRSDDLREILLERLTE